MEHWVYDNRVHRYARVHRGECTFCEHGQGLHRRGQKAAAGQWLGPFPSLAEAQSAVHATSRTVSRCSVCTPASGGSVGGADRPGGGSGNLPLQRWTPDLADAEVVTVGDAVEVVDQALGSWVVRFEPAGSSSRCRPCAGPATRSRRHPWVPAGAPARRDSRRSVPHLLGWRQNLQQLGQIFSDGGPEHVQVDVEVVMDEPVAHPRCG